VGDDMSENEFLSNDLKLRAKKHDYLFHYTSIDSLYKILENKSFKFNRLDLLNDLNEHKRNNSVEIDYYVLCFSNKKRESIPLWFMYADKCSGIIIKIKNCNIFENCNVFYKLDDEIKYFENKIISSDKTLKKIISIDKGIIELTDPELIDVIYSDDEINREFSKTFHDGGLIFEQIYPILLTGIKGEAWVYENETRYYVSASTLNRMDLREVFYEYNEKFYDELTIIFNPFIDDNNKKEIKDKVKSLIPEKHYLKINFIDSDLKNIINPDFLKKF